MKLVSLHIENFGGLSGYDLQLDEGLTVICQPNGFGKTTLAEFLRAMFYGFPRKGKTLDKSKRQKYTPWNGGSFGGNLIFEVDGDRYRLERTFGATPKGDTFTLIDLKTNKKSDRFSEEIGLELFQLDADSFERSTYMPQSRDLDSLTTDSIQAKLGDLVEDANDMGSYDKAVSALKSARSGLIPYRGNGGAVAEAQSNVTRLQREADQAGMLYTTKENCDTRIGVLENRLEESKEAQEKIRNRILRASEAAAVAAAHREHDRLKADAEKTAAAIAQLESRYPLGIPEAERLQDARIQAQELSVLERTEVTGRSDLDAAAILEENKDRFEEHLPEPKELEDCREWIGDHQKIRTEMENTGLSREENRQYEKLLELDRSGALTESRLEKLDEQIKTLTKLGHSLENAALSQEDWAELEGKKAYFAPGIPEEKTVEDRRKDLETAVKLRRENSDLAAQLGAQPEKKGGAGWLILLSVLALVLLGAGVGLMVYELTAYAFAALGVGALALIGAVICGVKLGSEANREKARIRKIRDAMEENKRQAEELEKKVDGFTGLYSKSSTRSEALYEIRDNLQELAELTGREETARQKRQQIEDEIRDLKAELTAQLGAGDFDDLLVELRLKKGQLRELQKELEEANRKTGELAAKGQDLEEKIRGLLSAYFEDVDHENFHSLLTRLQREADAYRSAREQVRLWQQRKEAWEQKKAACEAALNGFFSEFGVIRAENVRQQLECIQEDIRTLEKDREHLAQVREELEDFAGKHRKELEEPVLEPEDLDVLRSTEQRISEELESCSGELLDQKQLRSRTEEQLRLLPGIRDELELWQEKWNTGKENARLLDDTMAFLEKARENLQNSYLGPVRESFEGYMKKLLEEDGQRILLTTDLEVSLERSGKARELGYFSAGQTDTVMLCMRFALVDALFRDTKPFVILDDPFVNLDDERTEQALGLLRDLSKEKQILYLVCNSSRSI